MSIIIIISGVLVCRSRLPSPSPLLRTSVGASCLSCPCCEIYHLFRAYSIQILKFIESPSNLLLSNLLLGHLSLPLRSLTLIVVLSSFCILYLFILHSFILVPLQFNYQVSNWSIFLSSIVALFTFGIRYCTLCIFVITLTLFLILPSWIATPARVSTRLTLASSGATATTICTWLRCAAATTGSLSFQISISYIRPITHSSGLSYEIGIAWRPTTNIPIYLMLRQLQRSSIAHSPPDNFILPCIGIWSVLLFSAGRWYTCNWCAALSLSPLKSSSRFSLRY